MSEFQIDPSTFAPAGDAMDAAAEQLLASWEQLKEQSLAVQFGQYDDIAPLIQISLMSAVDIADECFATAGEELLVFSEGLRATGEVYAGAEEQTVQTVQQQQVEG